MKEAYKKINKFNNIKSLVNELVHGYGFKIAKVIPIKDFQKIKYFVKESFKENFKIENDISFEDIKNMHNNIDWERNRPPLTVEDRTLKREFALELYKQKWLEEICRLLNYKALDDWNLGYPSFTWRITRPNRKEDFRPVHRDVWFRLCNGEKRIIDNQKSIEIQTIKLWISLHSVPGKSGLLVAPNSHKKELPGFTRVQQDGFIKPYINKDELTNIETYCLNTEPGDTVFFGEKLLHGGAPNLSNTCRISLEICLCPLTYKPLSHIKV